MIGELVAGLQGLFASDLTLALALAALTALLILCCVPGAVIPVSLSSGALLGGWLGSLAVLAGVLAGSQALFLASRYLFRDRISARWGEWLGKFERHVARHGFQYVLGLRIAGAPHFLVTAGAALSPVRTHAFLGATLLGVLPAISLASAAGSFL